MGEPPVFAGRVALQQRVLPDYRVPFVDLLAESCRTGLYVFAGTPQPGEGIEPARRVLRAQWKRVENRYVGTGPIRLVRQTGVQDWLRDTRPDVLILESNPRNVSGWQAANWMRGLSKPVVGWGLGITQRRGPLGALGRQVWSRWLSLLDAVIAYSSSGAAEYIAAGFPAGRVFVAVNSVMGPPTRKVARQAASGRPLRILFVGRLQARKRLDGLFRALGRSGIAAQVRIVGSGPDLGSIRQAAEGLEPPVEFVGRLVGAELDDQYAWADLFVLPGTGGLAVQQAMASGLPVIVAESDGTQADLVTPKNGWLIPAADEMALAAALQQAAGEPGGLLEKGRESSRIVYERANIEVMRTVFLRALNAVAVDC